MNNNLLLNPTVSSHAKKSANVRKKKVLVWSDCAAVTTGFGIVSKYILKALHETGRYEIDQLAINHPARFHDRDEYPYHMIPAKLGNPQDPFGNQMLVDAVQKKHYDIVFVINDIFVTHQSAQYLRALQHAKKQKGLPVFSIVCYYPVDCRFMPMASGMVDLADVAVAYTKFGADATRIHLKNKPNNIIYHGTDINTYRPLPAEERRLVRGQYLRVHNDDTFVLVNVNRNSVRKDIARTILAFKEFRKKVPNSVLYLHTKPKDGTGGYVLDMAVPLEELALSPAKDVIFPNNYASSRGFPAEVLNQLYNAGDAYITTNLGEGWGLTITEAMAAGIPVIAPNHTTAPEILGDGERGYVVPCKEQIYIDNSGYRPLARMDDILDQMYACHSNWKTKNQKHQEVVKKAREFTERFSWDNVCKQWVTIFDRIKDKPTGTTADLEGELL